VIERQGQFSLGVTKDGELRAVVATESKPYAQILQGGEPLALGVWNHVALVADGAVLRLYRNGTEVVSVPYRGIANQPDYKRLNIGCDQLYHDDEKSPPVDGHYWNGWIDELVIFNHAISAEQVRQLYMHPLTEKRR
jgi:hypothetical protein